MNTFELCETNSTQLQRFTALKGDTKQIMDLQQSSSDGV